MTTREMMELVREALEKASMGHICAFAVPMCANDSDGSLCVAYRALRALEFIDLAGDAALVEAVTFAVAGAGPGQTNSREVYAALRAVQAVLTGRGTTT